MMLAGGRCDCRGCKRGAGNVVVITITLFSRRHDYMRGSVRKDFTLYSDHIPIKLYKASL